MEHKIGEIHISKTQTESVTKSGKKKISFKTSFPGLYGCSDGLDDVTMNLVKIHQKYPALLVILKVPKPLSDVEVMRMINPEEAPVEDARVGAG